MYVQEGSAMRTSEQGKDFIKACEGCCLSTYKCPGGKLTIGYGHTGADVSAGMEIDLERAEELFATDLACAESHVKRLVAVELTQGQFDALVSFAFNLGVRRLSRSTLLHKLNLGDYTGAANEFERWVYSGGKICAGLQKRRMAEKEMFLGTF